MKYTAENIKLISLFEKITRAGVKDLFFQNDQPIFVVFEGDLRKALGRDNSTLKKIERLLKKKIKIVEYSSSLLQFVLNVIAPIKVADIKEEDNKIIISSKDTKTRGYLIGRAAQNLRNNEKIVKNYYDIDEIRVL